MLPDSLIELFDITGSDDFPVRGQNDDELAELVYTTVSQTALLTTATVRFARHHGLNLIDFQVLLSVVTSTHDDITVTPGYISETLALSASTLTSILERLAEHDLIVRDQDSADKRRIALFYTETAAKLVVQYYRAIGVVYQEYFAGQRDRIENVTQAIATVKEAHVALVAKSMQNESLI